MKKIVSIVLLGLIAVAGCSETSAPSNPVSSYDGSKFLLNADPGEALEVIAAKESVADGDEVVVVGRIGGNANPWTHNLAAFYIVDTSLKACGEDTEGEPCSCKTPWDYCCESDIAEAMVFVQFEENGKVVKHDAKQAFGVKELQTVTIKGKAERTEGNSLIIHADGMFVQE